MDFKTRLIDEYKQLSERIAKLNQFTYDVKFAEIVSDMEQRSLLFIQLDLMIAYRRVLEMRMRGVGITLDEVYPVEQVTTESPLTGS